MIPSHVLLAAYRTGIFPMGNREGGLDWYSPLRRGIIPLDRVHVPKRLARLMHRNRFTVRIDEAFEDVVASCAAQEDSWITPEIIESYVELFRLGYAHSVETWEGKRLVGGLYGVSLRGAFFGESMFNKVTDASKVALVALADRLQARGYTLLDTQWLTEHLARFGAIEITREDYMRRLEESLTHNCHFVD
ncbi:MAG TPA: leucyl/phenylalanyl-tRNA--protein transferase [Vicinamibacterales bacterium]|nr:leucyl/phenylalanyl-tRNA--protein transferase [Vicinamibacterales bacterium]